MSKNSLYLGLIPLLELDDGSSRECGEHRCCGGDGWLAAAARASSAVGTSGLSANTFAERADSQGK